MLIKGPDAASARADVKTKHARNAYVADQPKHASRAAVVQEPNGNRPPFGKRGQSAPYSRRSKLQSHKKNRLSIKFDELASRLAAIDADDQYDLHVSIFAGAPANKGTADRRNALSVLTEIDYFFCTQGVTSTCLSQLRSELAAVEFRDEMPAMFRPARKAGRKSDNKYVQAIKGRLAGMAYVKMQFGMRREQAASWVARNVPSFVARKISRKPIHPSTVKEWMFQYGCSSRIRHDVRSLTTQQELWNFVKTGRISEDKGLYFGRLNCLSMIHTRREWLANGEPIPFQEISNYVHIGLYPVVELASKKIA